MSKVNIADKFAKISEYWKPFIAAELNGQHVKLGKLKGEFIFHHHENEDEMFLVVKGRFRMEFRAGEGPRAPKRRPPSLAGRRRVHRGAARCRAPSRSRRGVLDSAV